VITNHLPDWLSTYITETADELQVPQDAVALLSLGAVSAAINGGANTMPTSTWAEPVLLYTVALLASGEGKSPIYQRLLEPVVAAYDDVLGVTGSVDPKYQTIRNRVHRKHVKKIEQRCLKAVADGGMSLEEAVAEIAGAEREIGLFHSTAVPMKVLTDTTPAALVEAMQDNNGRVVIATPEAEGLLNFRGGSKEAILKGYDGETLARARKGDGEVTIKRPTITAMLAMQPTVLGILGVDMVNRGVMPRFLISYPDSKLGLRESRPRLVSPEAEESYQHEMTRIVKLYSDPTPKFVLWDAPAVREIGLWRDEIEPLLAPGAMLAPIAAWASKVRGGHFIRLAAILAIINGRETVNVQDCTDAKAILRSLMIDAKRAFGEMGASFAEDDLIHLMAIVNKLPATTFSKRDVMRRSNRLMSAPDRCTSALERAVAEGFIKPAGGKTGGQTWSVVE
jgi:replicative DNA helicase